MKISCFIFAVFVLLIAGCSESVTELEPNLNEEKVTIDEKMIKEMWQSPEWRAMMDIKRESLEFISQAIERGVTKEELKAAIATDFNLEGANSRFDDLVFQDPNTVDELRNSILGARKAFVDKYPQILTINLNEVLDEDGRCELTHDQSYRMIDNIDIVLEEHDSRYSLYKGGVDDLPPCGSWWNVAKLVSCATLASFGCGPGGPAALTLCGWGCWCMLCTENSALANAIC